MADHPLRPARDRRLGEPLPHQQANLTWVHLVAGAKAPLTRRYYAVLAIVSNGYPPQQGRSPSITHPSAARRLRASSHRFRSTCMC